MDGIEHPDHTGWSANPSAPWNRPDPAPLICSECYGLDEYAEVGDRCNAGDGSCNGVMREQDVCPGCNQPESRCYCDA